MSDLPWIGNPSLRLDLRDARRLAPALFGVSPRTQDLGLGPCTLHLGAPLLVFVAMTDVEGLAGQELSIPDDLALRGRALHAQAVVVGPVANALGLAFSAGLRMTVGD